MRPLRWAPQRRRIRLWKALPPRMGTLAWLWHFARTAGVSQAVLMQAMRLAGPLKRLQEASALALAQGLPTAPAQSAMLLIAAMVLQWQPVQTPQGLNQAY